MANVWEGFDPNLFNVKASDFMEGVKNLPKPMEDLSLSVSDILKDREARKQAEIENTQNARSAFMNELLTAGRLEAMGIDNKEALQRMAQTEQLFSSKLENADLVNRDLMSQTANRQADTANAGILGQERTLELEKLQREEANRINAQNRINRIQAVSQRLIKEKGLSPTQIYQLIREDKTTPLSDLMQVPMFEDMAKAEEAEIKLREAGNEAYVKELGKVSATQGAKLQALQGLSSGFGGSYQKDGSFFLPKSGNYFPETQPQVDNFFKDNKYVGIPTKQGYKYVPKDNLSKSDTPTSPANTMAALASTPIGEAFGLSAYEGDWWNNARDAKVTNTDYKEYEEGTEQRRLIDLTHQLAEQYGSIAAAINAIDTMVKTTPKLLEKRGDLLSKITEAVLGKAAPAASDVFGVPSE